MPPKCLASLVAASLVVSPAAVSAQESPMTASDVSTTREILTYGGVLLALAALLVAFQTDIFMNDDDETSVSP